MVFDERMASLESAAATGAAPRLLKLTSIADSRGTLIAADEGEVLPFSAVRYFLVQRRAARSRAGPSTRSAGTRS